MKMLPRSKAQSGQALLIVLLTMTVVMTVVLSVVSRSITDISVTTYEEEAQRAFDAAEAGIEQALVVGLSEGSSLVNDIFAENTRYNVSAQTALPTGDEYVHIPDILSGESATFWFTQFDDAGNLRCEPGTYDCFDGNKIEVCWGKPLPSEPSAVEITFYYDDSANLEATQWWNLGLPSSNLAEIKVVRFAFDTDFSRTYQNHFSPSSGTCNIAGRPFPGTSGDINLNPDFPIKCNNNPGCVIAVKVKMFYNSNDPQPVAVSLSNGSDFPPQGTVIESTGTSGESSRKVEVFQGFTELPFIFDAALFSPGDITK